MGRLHARRALRGQGADARPRRRPQPHHGRHLLALRLRGLFRPHRPRRPRVAWRWFDRCRGGKAQGGRRKACRPEGADRRLVARPDLFRCAPLHPAGPRPCLHHAGHRRAPRKRPHHERQQQGARTGRAAARGRGPSRHPARRRRPPERRDERPGSHDAGRPPRRVRPRHPRLRRARPALLREAVCAQGRDDRSGPRQPAAAGRSDHDAARDRRRGFSGARGFPAADAQPRTQARSRASPRASPGPATTTAHPTACGT